VVERIHTHIGSGTDPAVWQKVAGMSLALTRHFPSVHTLNLGGGYKVARMPTEKGTNLQTVGAPVRDAFAAFAAETGRKLRLEIEPGTYLVALAGVLVATVQDVVDTGADGYTFLRLDSGMTEILRPSLYGAQHPLQVVPVLAPAHAPRIRPQVVVGHCCESGDILTPAPGDSEGLLPRELPAADPGDLLVIGGAGAYCAGMSAKNYNSFPEAPEVLLRADGLPRLIRRRQALEQIVANEVEP
jgi:diaminopimelate decarboxylase